MTIAIYFYVILRIIIMCNRACNNVATMQQPICGTTCPNYKILPTILYQPLTIPKKVVSTRNLLFRSKSTHLHVYPASDITARDKRYMLQVFYTWGIKVWWQLFLLFVRSTSYYSVQVVIVTSRLISIQSCFVLVLI